MELCEHGLDPAACDGLGGDGSVPPIPAHAFNRADEHVGCRQCALDENDPVHTVTDTRTCWRPGDTEHDHAMCEDVVAEDAERVINGHTAAEWEAIAQEHERQARVRMDRSQESFERCDTDGFLSQWASDTTAREYEAKAALARRHGFVQRPALIGLDGTTVVAWRTCEGKYGPSWITTDAGFDLLGKRFVRDSEASKGETRRANNRKKGFTRGIVRAKGWVTLRGATATNVHPVELLDRDAMDAGQYTIVEVETSYADEN